MTDLSALWLPILLSAVIIFVVSCIIHMTPLWHKTDYPKVAKERELMDALRPLAIPPGDYMVPRAASTAEMRAAEFKEKMNKGPVLLLTVLPSGPFSMTRSMVLWFLYIVVVGFFAGYVTSRALPPGADYLRVFQLVGATAFASYTLALAQMSIWYRRAWSLTIKTAVDGLIYGLLTAGTFGWLWPQVS